MTVNLSALRIGHVYPPGNIPGTHFYWRLSRRQDHSTVGRIMSMKNSNDTSGIEPPIFRLVALSRVVFDGMLNKYMYCIEHNVDVSAKDSYEFSY